jgi:hypothetical protein
VPLASTPCVSRRPYFVYTLLDTGLRLFLSRPGTTHCLIRDSVSSCHAQEHASFLLEASKYFSPVCRLKVIGLLDVTRCTLAVFREYSLKMEAAVSSETYIPINQTARYHTQDDVILTFIRIISYILSTNHCLLWSNNAKLPGYNMVKQVVMIVTTVLFFFYSCCSHLEHRASVKRFISLQFLNFRQLVGLLGRGISPSQSRYLTTNTE